MSSQRQNKVARLIQKEIADIFQKETPNIVKGKMITVTVVRISPDLSIAKVYLSIFPSENADEALDTIREHVSHFRHLLGNRIRHQLRKIPELQFFRDDSLDYIEHIEDLLKK